MQLNSKSRTRAGLIAIAAFGVMACSDDPLGTDDGQIEPGTAVIQGQITGNRTFVPDTTYVLRGFVQVTSGATLRILPGTKIVGDTTQAGSSLFILRGARILAEGTADRPIVFTSQRAPGSRRPGDWGGIVIIGNARINRSVASALTEGPGAAAQNYAGGTNDDDSSGSLKYVRIEFAGYDVTGTGQELNSLSMYAVGRGTRLQYVQVHAGLDDGFEWFGGTVDGQYLVSSEAGDDHFDWTEGYRGRNQFLVSFQSGRLQPAAGTGSLGSDPRGFEGDGCDPDVAGCNANFRLNQPLSQPVFANFTMIGARSAGYPTGGNAVGLLVRRGTAGHFYNGIVARYNGFGISVRDTTTNNLRADGQLTVRNVAFIENGADFEPAGSNNFGQEANFPAGAFLQQTGAAATYFPSLSAGSLNLQPNGGAGFVTSSSQVPGPLFTGYAYGVQNAGYLGAVPPTGADWMAGWTNFRTD